MVPELTPEGARSLNVAYAKSLEEVVSGADYVSVHVPLTEDTRNCIGQSVFDAMPAGAAFVNTSRAEIVDLDALWNAIETRNIRMGLDVFRNEPEVGSAEFHSPLINSLNVYGTHHVGASTQQAEDAIGAEVVRIVEAYRAGKDIPNCVNLNDRTEASHVMTVRHADRVGVLARVLGVLSEAGHNVQEVQNVVFAGSHAACARIAFAGEPSDVTVSAVEADTDVHGVNVSARSR